MINWSNFTNSTPRNGALLQVSCRTEMKINVSTGTGDSHNWVPIKRFGQLKRIKQFCLSLRKWAKIGNSWLRSWAPRRASRSEKDLSTNSIQESKLRSGLTKRINSSSSTILKLEAAGLKLARNWSAALRIKLRTGFTLIFRRIMTFDMFMLILNQQRTLKNKSKIIKRATVFHMEARLKSNNKRLVLEKTPVLNKYVWIRKE